MKKLTKSELKKVMGGTDRKEEGFGCPGIIDCKAGSKVGDECYGGPDTKNCQCKGTGEVLSCS